MPCTYDGPGVSYVENPVNKQMKSDLDRLTKENDMLRETVLAFHADSSFRLSDKVLKTVDSEQVEHRKEDLKRLEKRFRKNRNAKMLGMVMLADPTKPLKPQLGFDPDDF